MLRAARQPKQQLRPYAVCFLTCNTASSHACRRVGLMGYNAKPSNVELVLAAFKDGLRQQGWEAAK